MPRDCGRVAQLLVTFVAFGHAAHGLALEQTRGSPRFRNCFALNGFMQPASRSTAATIVFTASSKICARLGLATVVRPPAAASCPANTYLARWARKGGGSTKPLRLVVWNGFDN